MKQQLPDRVKNFFRVLFSLFFGFWKERFWRRLIICLAIFIFVWFTSMYTIARWYSMSQDHKPLTWGATFVPSYAGYLGVDPRETLDAMIEDLGLRRFRLVSYWNELETTEGKYDFSKLDWQFERIAAAGGEITLAIGLRQPRWPECHMPDWAQNLPKDKWAPKLNDFIRAVVERYRDNPALISYQLENEFHLTAFGRCPDHDRNRLIQEFDLVKQLDSSRPLILTRSNNVLLSWPVGKPRADIVGIAVYKRTWGSPPGRYLELPFPASYYSFLAGATKLTTDRDSFIHELQVEPFLPSGFDMRTAPIKEQDKSMNARLLTKRLDYGKDTGLRTIDLWGVEWWYWRKVKHHDPSLWDTGKAYLETH